MKFYMLDGNEKILCAVPSKDIISLYQNLNYHQADTIEGSLVLSEKYTSILNNVRYFAISDRESNHNFYLYRKTLVQVQNHEIAINGQGAFWDEMQGAYIKDKRPNQVTPADTIKLILGYSRWNVDYVDQMLEEESLRRDMNFYYVSLLDALNTVYQTWQVDIEPYINIEGHQITRRYVKLYQQQGGNNGRRFVYGDNALTVTQQANEGSIFTALVGRGAGVEETDADGNLTGGYSRKINFADVEWSKANGDPVDKPKGQEYVEWKESTEIYGYSDGKPRIGIVDFDNEKDPAQLLKETWAQLQQVGVPLVQFQATVGDVGYLNLGETVTIVRYDLNIKYQTRVTGIKWNRCDEAKSQITIGVKAIQSTADKIAGLQQSVAQANVNADEAKSTANHAIIDGTGAVVNYGPNEPTNPKEGDIWYDVQPDGTVVLKQYQNGQWVILIDDTTGQQIKNKVEAQQKELDKAVQDANAAFAKADGLVAQVGDANTNAQKALTTAQQNQSDLSQAKLDLQNTKNTLSGV
ncbi:phage tail spike protein, partial [Ligilactobacillus aviarius]|uniref:phage tail spike protein n=3 Tax=Ligilactobacillus aviarius TaxID=1606 RepID=UPI0031E1BCC2